MSQDAGQFEQRLKEALPGSEVTPGRNRRYWVSVGASELLHAVETLRAKFGIRHLSTIAAEDLRDHFLVNYFFSGEGVVTLQVKVDHDNPEIPTLGPEVAGALVYEREVHDLFGIKIVGHPDMRRQALPDDWPEGVFPLRKDVKLARATLEAGVCETK